MGVYTIYLTRYSFCQYLLTWKDISVWDYRYLLPYR